MKIGEAQKIYREERQNLIDQRKALINQRDELRKKNAKDRNSTPLKTSHKKK